MGFAQINRRKAKENFVMAKYARFEIFSKNGNLLEYFSGKTIHQCCTREQYERMKTYYAREREIFLTLGMRRDGDRLLCKISCPINPLPVKGEFEVPSYSVLCGFLRKNGWTPKGAVSTRYFAE